MESVIGVECWADYYFFGKLLQNRHLIRKEQNKSQVITGLLLKNANNFSVGIVDDDNEEIDGYINAINKKHQKQFEVEYREDICAEIKLIKIRHQSIFILQLLPKDFEKWIVKFVEVNSNKSLTDFGYNNQKELDRESKVVLAKVESNEKLKVLFNFVLAEHLKADNHILKLKNVIHYLLAKKHNVDINEVRNV